MVPRTETECFMVAVEMIENVGSVLKYFYDYFVRHQMFAKCLSVSFFFECHVAFFSLPLIFAW